jgi:hypothetical protein
MTQKVQIRFLGMNWRKGIPKKRFIQIEGDRFYNYRRFQEQLPDASYIRDIEFYEKHKGVLDNKLIFVLTFIEEAEPDLLAPPEDKIPEIEEVYNSEPCQYCGRVVPCKNLDYVDRVLKSHEARCEKNPNNQINKENTIRDDSL